jgi:hypothetical protein
MIKFIKSLFAPAVKIETPVAEYKIEAPVAEVVPFPVPAESKPARVKKPSVKKATTRKPRAPKAPK